MRLTTKIIIGIILATFIIPLTFIIAFSFSGRKYYDNSSVSYERITISTEHKTVIDVGSYKVVVLEEELVDPNIRRYWYNDDECCLYINDATTESENNKLSIPAALVDCIVVNTSNDTLTIKIKLDELGQKYEKADKESVAISGMRFDLYTSTVDIVNKSEGILTEIRNVQTDEIKVKAETHIYINGCDANKVTIEKAGSLNIENSKLKELSLGALTSWKVGNCRIVPVSDK